MARTLCSEIALQLVAGLETYRTGMEQALLTCLKRETSLIKTIVNFARLYCRNGTGKHVPSGFNDEKCQVVIQQCEGYTQH